MPTGLSSTRGTETITLGGGPPGSLAAKEGRQRRGLQASEATVAIVWWAALSRHPHRGTCVPSKARLQSFRRVLRYLRPQRRRLMVSVLCALGMALAYTGTIGGVLPVLKLLIANEGPRTTAFRYIAGQRLGAELGDYRPERGRFPTPLPEHALIVRSVKVNSALEPTGVQPGDALFLAEDPAESTNLLEMLAAAPANQPVLAEPADDDIPGLAADDRVVAFIPGGDGSHGAQLDAVVTPAAMDVDRHSHVVPDSHSVVAVAAQDHDPCRQQLDEELAQVRLRDVEVLLALAPDGHLQRVLRPRRQPRRHR